MYVCIDGLWVYEGEDVRGREGGQEGGEGREERGRERGWEERSNHMYQCVRCLTALFAAYNLINIP